MLWLQPAGDGTQLVWAAYDGSGWSLPEPITTGQDFLINWADFPSLAMAGETPIAAHWLEVVPGGIYAYHAKLAFRSESGTWSQPVTIHRDRSATEHGFVAMSPVDSGDVLAIWLDGHRTIGQAGQSHEKHAASPDLSTAMTLRSVVLSRDGKPGEETEIDGSVCDCCQTSLARSGNRIIAVYRNRTRDEVRDIYSAVFDLRDGRWGAPRALSQDGWEIAGCPVNGPAVAAFADTVIATWFSAANEQPRTYMSVSRDGGLTFSGARPLGHEASIGRVGVSFNDAGQALLTWMESADERAVVYGRLWAPSGLGERFIIGDIDASRASGFPRAAALGKDFLVAWTEPGFESEVVTESSVTTVLVSLSVH